MSHILLRKLPEITQQDKKVNLYFIIKRGAPAPRYICDMSAEKRAARCGKTWGSKKPRGHKNRRGPWHLPKVRPPLDPPLKTSNAGYDCSSNFIVVNQDNHNLQTTIYTFRSQTLQHRFHLA